MLEGHAAYHGESRCLFRGAQCRFRFEHVAHGFDDDKIRAAVRQGPRLNGERVVHVFRAGTAHWLHEAADGAHGAGGHYSVRGGCRFRHGGRRAIYFSAFAGEVVIGELDRICAKRVCRDYIRAAFRVRFVNGCYKVGPFKVEQFNATGKVRELLKYICSHRAVEQW